LTKKKSNTYQFPILNPPVQFVLTQRFYTSYHVGIDEAQLCYYVTSIRGNSTRVHLIKT